MVGFSIAMVILAGISIYMTYRDMKAFYKVDFTPIPHYMIDEKDLIGYNAKGEKIVLKNQSAYYKAVFCNRKPGDEYYKTVGNVADLNGDVGKQWLALYAESNENKNPILADSLKYVSVHKIPSGYEKGIHMFGTDAAENLNNPLYVWNDTAPMVYVYFKTDDVKANPTGSNFTAGTLALSVISGAALGAIVTLLCEKATKKRGKTNAVTA